MTQKIAIWAPSHNFVALYLRNWGMYRQLEKKLVKQQYVLQMSPQYGELRPTSGWDWFTSLGYPCKFQLVSHLGNVTARHLVVGVSQTLRRWTEGATYIRQCDHHVGHWPTLLFMIFAVFDPLLLTVCINCSFLKYILITSAIFIYLVWVTFWSWIFHLCIVNTCEISSHYRLF